MYVSTAHIDKVVACLLSVYSLYKNQVKAGKKQVKILCFPILRPSRVFGPEQEVGEDFSIRILNVQVV